MAAPRQLHLGAFMRPVSIHTGAWRWPGAWPDANFSWPRLRRLAQKLEAGCFDAFFMADHLAVLNMGREALRHSHTVTSFEPFTLLSALAAVTDRIGLVATGSTSFDAPFHVARRFASLDHLSNGRAGWNIVTTSNPDAALNFGLEEHLDHDERYRRAREFFDVVTGLWDSFADDAFLPRVSRRSAGARRTATGRVDTKPLAGVALASAGYACFSLQDAVAKWLVADYAVPQILFMRSLVIVVVAGALARHRRHPSVLRSPHRGTLVLRAALMLGAWLLFYNAARHLGLAELSTLYFSAPVIVVFLSILVLKEKVGLGRWIACLGGFAGVVVAANPAHLPNLVPAAMCVLAGFCWAWSTVLIRLVSRSETTLSQMFATSLLFGIACAVSFPWIWKTPDAFAWMLMFGLGLVATLGQYLLYEGFRYAPASALAPTEYTGLLWAFLYGYAIWAEIPALHVFAGAVLIVLSSLILVWWEHRGAQARRGHAT